MKDLFFYFEGNALILWDVRSHSQWEIDQQTANALISQLLSSDGQDIEQAKQFIRQNGGSVDTEAIHSAWHWDILSYLFHIGTSNIATNVDTSDAQEWSKDYQEYSSTRFDKVAGMHDYPKSDIPFNTSNEENDIYHLFAERETHREFISKPVSFQCLEKMLVSVFAFRQTESFERFIAKNDIKTYLFKRSAPSAGGLQSVDVYINVKNVAGVEPGVYQFNPRSPGLIHIGEMITDDELVAILNGQPFANNSAFDLIYTSRFDRLWNKYEHSRGYRAALLDVGHLSENMLLCSKFEGLEAYVTGSFADQKLSEKLHVDLPVAPLFFSSFGYGDQQFIPMRYFQ